MAILLITSILVEHNNTIIVEQATNFFDQQMVLHKQYSTPLLTIKLKTKM